MDAWSKRKDARRPRQIIELDQDRDSQDKRWVSIQDATATRGDHLGSVTLALSGSGSWTGFLQLKTLGGARGRSFSADTCAQRDCISSRL